MDAIRIGEKTTQPSRKQQPIQLLPPPSVNLASSSIEQFNATTQSPVSKKNQLKKKLSINEESRGQTVIKKSGQNGKQYQMIQRLDSLTFRDEHTNQSPIRGANGLNQETTNTNGGISSSTIFTVTDSRNKFTRSKLGCINNNNFTKKGSVESSGGLIQRNNSNQVTSTTLNSHNVSYMQMGQQIPQIPKRQSLDRTRQRSTLKMPPLHSANIIEEQYPSPLNFKKKQSHMIADNGNSPSANNNQARISKQNSKYSLNSIYGNTNNNNRGTSLKDRLLHQEQLTTTTSSGFTGMIPPQTGFGQQQKQTNISSIRHDSQFRSSRLQKKQDIINNDPTILSQDINNKPKNFRNNQRLRILDSQNQSPPPGNQHLQQFSPKKSNIQQHIRQKSTMPMTTFSQNLNSNSRGLPLQAHNVIYSQQTDKILMDDHHQSQSDMQKEFTITMMSPASGGNNAFGFQQQQQISSRKQNKKKQSQSPYRTLGSSQNHSQMASQQYSNLKRSSKVSYDQVLFLPPLSSHPNHPYTNNQSSIMICETPLKANEKQHPAATTSTTGQSINSQQFKSYFSKNHHHEQSHQGEVIVSSTERGRNQNQEPLLLLKEKKNQAAAAATVAPPQQQIQRNSNEVLQTLRSHSIAEQQLTKYGSKTEFPDLPGQQKQLHGVHQFLTRHNTNDNVIKKHHQQKKFVKNNNRLQNNQSITLNRQMLAPISEDNVNLNATSNNQKKQRQAAVGLEKIAKVYMNRHPGAQRSPPPHPAIISQQQQLATFYNHSNLHKHSTSVIQEGIIDGDQSSLIDELTGKLTTGGVDLYSMTPQQEYKGKNKIKIEVNKEDSILDYLTSEHKANMSLLFYDFNHHAQKSKTATGALSSAASNNPQNGAFGQHLSNLADVIIPEEAAEENFPKDHHHHHSNQLNDDKSIEERSDSSEEEDDEEDDEYIQQQNSPYIMTIEDEQLLTRQDTLLKEIFNVPPHQQFLAAGDQVRQKQNNSTLGLPQPKNKPLLLVSPRDNQAVEMVNQKIETAKRKMSRYFQARGGPNSGVKQILASGGNLEMKQTSGGGGGQSLTQLSMEMVRLGSPFFGVTYKNKESPDKHHQQTVTDESIYGLKKTTIVTPQNPLLMIRPHFDVENTLEKIHSQRAQSQLSIQHQSDMVIDEGPKTIELGSKTLNKQSQESFV